MRLIRPSYEIIVQGPGLQGIYDIIELCGKISYKSTPKGGETARKFVEARIKEGHGAVLEFGTVYLKFKYQNPVSFDFEEYDWYASDAIDFYQRNPYSRVAETDDYFYITTNYRVLVENDRLDDLKYLCEPTEYHQRRYAVKFITDIGLGRDFLRHRVMSMVQESTRYVNYMKEKFGSELTFVIPPWISEEELATGEGIQWWDGDWVDINKMKIINGFDCAEHADIDVWLDTLLACEMGYQTLINYEWAAQEARTILPLATKTEFVLCGFWDAWVHFFCLRSDIAATGKAHPMSIELANPLRDEFIRRKYITKENLKHDTMAGFDVCAADMVLKP